MKNINLILWINISFLLAVLTGCQNEPELATITTSPVVSIANNSAVSGGYISDDGGADLTSRGVVWNTSPNPTTANNSSNEGNGPGSFTSNLSGLTANTTYYVRAFAINSAGTSYGNQQSFTTINSAIVSNQGAGVTYNGYTYSSVVLGNGQEWMSENLQTANYRNGDPITTGLDNSTWHTASAGAFAIYDNDLANDAIYGKLYNWYAVTDPRHVCPTNWHEPTDSEWSVLINYLDPNSNGGDIYPNTAGGKMKSTSGWNDFEGQSANGTNESGFSGQPGGNRFADYGQFTSIGQYGYWWSSTESTSTGAWTRGLGYDSGSSVGRGSNNKRNGFSVRCLRD
jgi:uncharacterized protein (TIGR02145 family)